jgi:uncharacterized membrane protein
LSVEDCNVTAFPRTSSCQTTSPSSPCRRNARSPIRSTISGSFCATTEDLKSARNQARGHFFRFHLPHAHLHSLYGDDWFALKAEKFARFFGTPTFLVGQTIIVGTWILINIAGWTQFDVYPFILLNLAFSLQAAYAAPLILLAQTRQADRDKAHAEADALHREDLARVNDERQSLMAQQTNMLLELVTQNTQLTETIKTLTERVEVLTTEVHKQVTLSTSP